MRLFKKFFNLLGLATIQDLNEAELHRHNEANKHFDILQSEISNLSEDLERVKTE